MMRGMASPRQESDSLDVQVLVDSIPALIHTARPDGYLDYFNKPWLEYLGVTLDKVTGWNWTAAVHPEDVEGIVAKWRACLATGEIFEYETRVRRANGEYRWMFHRKVPLRDANGNIVKWYGSSLDIEERKTAEEKLRRSELDLHSIIETIPTMVWSAAPDGSVDFFNPRWRDYTGLSPDQSRDWRWTAAIQPDDLSRLTDAWQSILVSGEPGETEARLRRFDDAYRWFLFRANPLRDESGKIVKWYGTNVDIEDRKRAEEELRRSEFYLSEGQRLAHMGSWVLDAAGCFPYWSHELFHIYGLDPAKEGPSFEEYLASIHPQDREFMRSLINRMIAEASGCDVTKRIVRPSGEVRYVRCVGVPIVENGTLKRIVGSAIDVTEHELLTQELRRREAYLTEAQRLSHTGSFGWRPDTGEIVWSDETYRIFEYGRSVKSTIDSVVQRVHPQDRADFQKVIDGASRGAPDLENTNRLLLPDGRVKHVHAIAHVLQDASGNREFVGAVTDITERKVAEEALRSSEAYLAEAQRLSHTGSWSWSPATDVRYWSEECYRILGFDPRDGAPRIEQLIQRIHPDDQPAFRESAMRARHNKLDEEVDYRIVHPGGAVRDVHSIGHPVFSPCGDLIEFTGTVIDITERKRAEEDLRASERKYRHLVDTTPAFIHTALPDGTLDFLSRGWLEYGGLPQTDFLDWRWTAAIHPEDLEGFVDKWRAALASGEPFVGESRVRRADGEYRWILQRNVPLRDETGKIVKWYGTGIDIEERKRAEESLRNSEAYLAEAQRLSHTGSWAWSPEHDIRYWSEECYRVLSFDPRDGLPRFEDFFQRIHPDDQPGFLELIQTAIREKAEWEADYRIVHPDGPVRDIHVVGHPVLSTSGHLVEFVGTVIDVTERGRAEQERARLRQMEADLAHINRVSTLGEMAASLAHEITQPIATARNNARAALNFLDGQPPELGEVREALACVVGDADRAGEIIDRIRDHIRKAPPRKARFDLNDAIDEVIVLGRSAITKNEVSVQTRLAEGLFPVEGDRVQLQQVILNLVLNAVEAMSSVKAGPRDLLIGTEQIQGNGVLVTVRDSGPGIGPENLERVFEAFYTTKTTGVGMGLSICRSIVDTHGGRLWADANEPRGAVFRFTLPGAENELTNREPREGTVSTAPRQLVCEGNR